MISPPFKAGLLCWVLSLFPAAKAGAQLLTSFIEPDAGRDPITSALGQATQSIEMYVFTLTLPSDDPIVTALGAAVASGVALRAIVEPCPGESASCSPPNPDAVSAYSAIAPWSTETGASQRPSLNNDGQDTT